MKRDSKLIEILPEGVKLSILLFIFKKKNKKKKQKDMAKPRALNTRPAGKVGIKPCPYL